MKKKYHFKKILSAILSFLLLGSFSFISFADSTIQPEHAPLNEAFKDYLNAPNKQNHIPSPVKIIHTNSNSKKISSLSELPSKFDLREKGKLTPIRDQGKEGTCWAFATYGAIESRLLPNEEWDFSEDNLSQGHGRDFKVQDGGNQFLSIAYLSRWNGPVLESEDPYGDGSSPSNLKAQKHLQEALFISKEQIKETLMEYGGVHTCIYAGEEDDEFLYYNPDTYAFYYDGDKEANHDITIVGWDDDFPADEFIQKPPGDGAFICRNSWGTDFGEEGYYYVSYYDAILGSENTVYTGIEDPANYDYIYQYDPLGWTDDIGYHDETAWFSNVFTNNSEIQDLSAVSFYTKTNDASYEIWVNSDFDNGEFSNIKKVKEGIIENPGYHTIPLDEPILLQKNKFAVAIKLTTPGYDYPVAIEEKIENYSSHAVANPGESYLSPDGINWTDITSREGDNDTNVCLKAFTKKSDSPIDFNTCYKWKPESNVPVTKVWKIKFNQGLSKDYITSNYIKVLEGKTLKEIDMKLDYDEQNNVIEVIPTTSYLSGEGYYLYIDKNIQSSYGKHLQDSIIMNFTIQP